ncbi:MAG TPA: hypothetical protein P5123_10075 [Spirochaetota bacterium]|nr:hypothetical protein [Spirochaetota bacterium]
MKLDRFIIIIVQVILFFFLGCIKSKNESTTITTEIFNQCMQSCVEHNDPRIRDVIEGIFFIWFRNYEGYSKGFMKPAVTANVIRKKLYSSDEEDGFCSKVDEAHRLPILIISNDVNGKKL